jgi:hypothetical protein
MLFKKGRNEIEVRIEPRAIAILAAFLLVLVGAVDPHSLTPFLHAAGSLLHLGP